MIASASVWRRRAVPLGIAVLTFLGLALTAPKGFFGHHTAFNHFALLAEGWLHGRLDLGGPPPAYTQFNDFALFEDRFFVSFPPFPALVLLPFVALFGSADATPDGAVFLLVAATAPAIFYLALRELRAAASKTTPAQERSDVVVGLALPFCTVFWFSAVQGTVWFAAHVVGVALASAYLWASVNARRPLLAGTFLILAFATRTPMALAAPFFVLELLARARQEHQDTPAAILGMLKPLMWFVLPVALGLVMLCAYNQARFHDPFEFGHRHLQVVWRPRMDKWGLFSLHYLGKNLGVALGSMPFLGDPASKVRLAAFQISGHGLALWITSPFLLLALWRRPLPTRQRLTYTALAITAALIAIPDLLYHNTGWVQFGYRFSNDFVVFVLAMLAVGRRQGGPTLYVLLAWSFAVNLFGALSFQRPGWEKYYKYDIRPDVYFEPD